MPKKRPHGKICIGFTPDEEVGQGADLFDVAGFGAEFGYTVDGGDVNEINYENFNAAAAVVTVHGFSVHPGSAKDKMKNAMNIAMEFHAALPAYDRPEHTEGYEGFFHLTSMIGDVTTAKLGYIVRDHDTARFNDRKTEMAHIAARLNDKYGAGTVELDLKDSYYNMIEKIEPHFHLVENARKAIAAVGLEPANVPIRGGTDGAMLSFKGLPCPQPGHRRLQLPRPLRVRHGGEDGPDGGDSAAHRGPVPGLSDLRRRVTSGFCKKHLTLPGQM